MRNQTLTLMAVLFAVVLPVRAALSEDALEEEKREASQEATRSIQPTESDLEAFRLPENDASTRPELSPNNSPALQISGIGVFASSAADLVSTEYGLSQGLREGNPVASDRGARIALHVAGPAAVWWTTEKLRREGKTKLALVLRIGLMAAYSYAAIHNVRQVHASPGGP